MHPFQYMGFSVYDEFGLISLYVSFITHHPPIYTYLFFSIRDDLPSFYSPVKLYIYPELKKNIHIQLNRILSRLVVS